MIRLSTADYSDTNTGSKASIRNRPFSPNESRPPFCRGRVARNVELPHVKRGVCEQYMKRTSRANTLNTSAC